MGIKSFKVLIVGLLVMLLAFGLSGQAMASNHETPGRYIVVLKSGVSLDDVVRDHGLAIGQRYSKVLKGFAAEIPASKLGALKSDSRIKYLEKDQLVHMIEGQVLSTGVDRIDGENLTNKGTGIKVAVIDTGIDKDHPDLEANIAGGVNFVGWWRVSPDRWDDDNGHGSWVAGIIAAVDNDIGYVGVAPETSLYGVKVLNRWGSGNMSDVIAGVDWAAENGMQVANMSLGAKGTSAALHEAIINATNAGVTIVVAAGNDSADANAYIPATYDEVITVSAIADSDGQPGGQGPATYYGADDTFATLSNYGEAIDIAAPGVDISSTYKNAGYATGSGTSGSCPHVAGVAALYIATNNPAPADVDGDGVATIAEVVRQALIDCGWAQTDPEGFSGDPDTYPEPLVNAAAVCGPAALQITTTSLPDAVVGTAYSATVEATGGTTPYTWSVVSGSLPDGLALNSSTGVISGTPSTAGTSGFTVQVADSSIPEQTDTQALSIAVALPLEVTTTSLPDGTVGIAYSAMVEATGGTTPYTWSVVSGSLPDGLALNSFTGVISGTPSTAGTSGFTVQVADSSIPEQTDTQALSITIAPGSLTIITTSLPDGTVGIAYSAMVEATGGTTPYTWSIVSGSLPDGLALNSFTGIISGTPSTAGTSGFTVQVADSSIPEQTDTQALSITIVSVPTMTVLSVEVELISRWGGRIYYAQATVTIVDNLGNPVQGATVSGDWSGATSDKDYGITDANGQVTLRSNWVRTPASGTTFTFTVTSVTHPDFPWDSVEKSGSATVP